MKTKDIVKLMLKYEKEKDFTVLVKCRKSRKESRGFDFENHLIALNNITFENGGFCFNTFYLEGNPSKTVCKKFFYTARQIKSISLAG